MRGRPPTVNKRKDLDDLKLIEKQAKACARFQAAVAGIAPKDSWTPRLAE